MNGKMRFIGIILALLLSITSVFSSIYFLGLDENYINAKLKHLGVNKIVPNFRELNNNVVLYLKGKSQVLTKEFTEREVKHLSDVKHLFLVLKILVTLFFMMFLAISYFVLEKIKGKESLKFFAKVLLHGGICTLVFSLLAFFLMSFSFENSFDSFHRIFFEQGTYLFDPSTEMLTRLYPQELFQSLAMRISIGITSLCIVWIFMSHIINSKAKNIK